MTTPTFASRALETTATRRLAASSVAPGASGLRARVGGAGSWPEAAERASASAARVRGSGRRHGREVIAVEPIE